MEYEIIYGSRAVWVNSPKECLGRFGWMGIDVHATIESQMTNGTQCLYCTHAPTTTADWPRFINAMREFHGIELRDQLPPSWLSDRISG